MIDLEKTLRNIKPFNITKYLEKKYGGKIKNV